MIKKQKKKIKEKQVEQRERERDVKKDVETTKLFKLLLKKKDFVCNLKLSKFN